MKKSNLITGILYTAFGAACLCTALLTENKLDSLLFGLSGAGIGPGILMICKYLYWSSPKNKERYQEKLENEKREQHDELNEKVRDKSGRFAYVLGLIVVSISMVVLSVLDVLEIIDNSQILLFYLSGYLLFQIVAGIVIFNHLIKKY